MSRRLHIKQVDGKPGEVYYPLQISEVPRPKPGDGQVLVRIAAAALNHRDLFIRQHLYPAIAFDSPMLADGCGTVVELGSNVTQPDLLNKRVLLTPMRGWESDPDGPDGGREYAVVGSSRITPDGMAQDYIAVSEKDVVAAPEHLSTIEGAALPLVGLTGWRALVTKTSAGAPGKNILITGIGGGVALQTLQFGVAFGANVFITSSDPDKIERAKQLGAKGGVNYKEKQWEAGLRSLLPKDRPFLDAVIDGAGGDVVLKAVKLLKPGGVISQYGMTVGPKMDWSILGVLNNIELKGTAMGSRCEFRDMVAFVSKHKIHPVVSTSVKGLDNLEAIDGLFSQMKAGSQFGKLVIEFNDSESSKL